MNNTDLHVLYVSAVLGAVSVIATVLMAINAPDTSYGDPMGLAVAVAVLDLFYMAGRSMP